MYTYLVFKTIIFSNTGMISLPGIIPLTQTYLLGTDHYQHTEIQMRHLACVQVEDLKDAGIPESAIEKILKENVASSLEQLIGDLV
jgi:hypothetical protein